MRALLIVNPSATSTTPLRRDVIASALASAVKLEVAHTRHRGHAASLAADACCEGYGLVLTLGGDGTVNEAVNGILGWAEASGQLRPGGPPPEAPLPDGKVRDGTVRDRPLPYPPGLDPPAAPPGGAGPAGLPALAALPGGSANVFTRALGLPRDPVDAAGVVLRCLADGTERTIGAGLAADRFFVLNAGLGIDAEVVRAVHGIRSRGRTVTPGLYVRMTLGQIYRRSDRRHPALTIEADGEQAPGPVFAGMVLNTSPWTYLGSRAVQASPQASFDCGLDVFALRSLSSLSTFRAVGQMLAGRRAPHGGNVFAWHDKAAVTICSHRPIACQIDGEYVGERERVSFAAVPRALRVIA